MTARENILANVKYETLPSAHSLGGQTVGIPYNKIKLISEDTCFEVIVWWEKSTIKNKELALKLFIEYLDLLKIE